MLFCARGDIDFVDLKLMKFGVFSKKTYQNDEYKYMYGALEGAVHIRGPEV